MDERDDYVLGRNVTKQALGKERLTSVVSIRMTSEEMDAVSAVAEREGKTFAQVAREAIREMTAAKRLFVAGGAQEGVDDAAALCGGPAHRPANKERRVAGEAEPDQAAC